MILLVGASGYIGKEFTKQLSVNHIEYLTITHTECKRNILIEIIKNNNIKYIINCAAFIGKPNIEACESQKNKCIEGNILLPILLKDICEEQNIIYCHISTGCLYNGEAPSPNGFKETDKPNFTFELNNCGFYTGCKALAEKIIKKYEKSYIWRIRLPFEEYDNERNYISKILKYDTLITEKNSISNKREIVNACIQSILKQIPFGIYHMTNGGSVSALDLVEKIKKTIMPNKKAIFITIDEFYKKISNMPRSNCITDNSKILSAGIEIPNVEESIDYCLNHWKWK